MAISNRVGKVLVLLNRIRDYDRLIITDNFEPNTIEDMKGNAKDICNQAKGEIDAIKVEIGEWS